jgi:methyl-accepting chemotaxis protein
MIYDSSQLIKTHNTRTDISMFDLLQIPAMIIDNQNIIQEINQSCEQHLNISAKTCIGSDYRNIISFEELTDRKDPVQFVLKDGVPFAGVVVASQNNVVFQKNLVLFPVIDESGQVSNVIAYCKDSFSNSVLNEIDSLKKMIQAGDLSARISPEGISSQETDLVDQINNLLDIVTIPFTATLLSIRQIADGNIPAHITRNDPGYFPGISDYLNTLLDVIHMRNDDIKHLTDGAMAGKLDIRADPSRYPGENGKMIKEINAILDAYIGPINISAEYIDRVSKGEVPPRITQEYQGDFNEIKNNLNALIDVIHMRNDDIKHLTDGAIAGKLDVRADPSRYPGENGRMIKEINAILDAYIGPINISAEYIDRVSKGEVPPHITQEYQGDFNEIKNNLNALIDVIHMRNDDIKMLISAALEGNLSYRADPTRYPGENGTLIQGINDILDVVIGPLNFTSVCMDNIAKGNIPKKITEVYKGSFNEIKNNLNTCIDAINLLIDDTNMLAKAAVRGKLRTRADSSHHQGDFKKIVEGVNATLDAIITPFEVVHKQVGLIVATSEETASSLEEVTSGSKEVFKNSEHVTENAEKCHDSLTQVLKAVEDFSSTVAQVSGKADSVYKIADATNHLCETGMVVAKSANQGMDGITRSTSEVNLIVSDIGAQMHEIGKIVSLISDIASQTNLLALNAAIEAARAGEAGRGFAVVASEVKSLAQDSRRSAENITDMIQVLQQKSQDATDAMKTADGEIEAGNKAMKETLEVFTRIVTSVAEINRNIEEVASASEEQAASVQEITASLNEVSSLVRETAEEAQKSSATTRESTVALDQISTMVTDLSGVVDTLSSEISKFEI